MSGNDGAAFAPSVKVRGTDAPRSSVTVTRRPADRDDAVADGHVEIERPRLRGRPAERAGFRQIEAVRKRAVGECISQRLLAVGNIGIRGDKLERAAVLIDAV